MHGTYRMHVERDAGLRTVRFAQPRLPRSPWRAILRLSSCLAIGAGLALVPANPFKAERRLAQQVVVLPATPKPFKSAARAPLPATPAEIAPAAPPARSITLAAAVEPVPQLAPAAPVVLEVAAVPTPPAFVVPPAAPRRASAALPAAAPRREPAALSPLRRVDIAQLTDRASQPLHVPQLREPGLVAGAAATLVAKVDAMQVPLPAPPQLAREERAALLAEAPSEMTVRAGADAVGKVAFRMSETGTIDVQLSGLLDLVADRMTPEEYTRLRGAAAAGTYVPLDRLRAIGLSVRYDPVYDELDLSA